MLFELYHKTKSKIKNKKVILTRTLRRAFPNCSARALKNFETHPPAGGEV